MRRFAFAAVPCAFLLISAACGDDGSQSSGELTSIAGSAQQTAQAGTPTTNANDQPQVPDKALPTPTPVPDTSPVIQVGSSGNIYAPSKAEFATLPRIKISSGGKDYEGVSLAVLAEKGAPRTGAIATIQGTRFDNLRLGAIRFPLADIAASTVLIMDASGHITLASTSIPSEQWLKDVISVALN